MVRLSTTAKARIRLAIVALALIPVAIIARCTYSETLMEFVQRTLARAELSSRAPRDGGAD